MAVGVEQNLDGHAEEPGRFPGISPALHQPRCSFPEHNILLIEVDYWVGASWLLVWVETGKSTAIVAPPHYSPDKRWLASVAYSVGPSGPPNGMDIVPSIPDRKFKEWHYRTPDDGKWLYEFSRWDGNTRVNVLASSLGSPQRSTTTIEFRNGDRHFSEPE